MKESTREEIILGAAIILAMLTPMIAIAVSMIAPTWTAVVAGFGSFLVAAILIGFAGMEK